MNQTTILRIGALLGALAVALGAFGAHALHDRLDAQDLATYETAARYQIYHALAIVLCGLLPPGTPRIRAAAGCLIAGTVVFSGSLYALVLTGPRWLGAITPIGGTLLIGGWILLASTRLRPADQAV